MSEARGSSIWSQRARGARLLNTALVLLIAGGLMTLGPGSRAAHAALISTEAIVEEANPGESTRGRLLQLVERDDVAAELAGLGIDPDTARRTIQALSEQELAVVEGRLAELPAGGSVGAVVGTAAVIFLVLLFTDILGFTKIFPWVNR